MTRKEIYAEVEHVLGGVPGWLSTAPDGVLEQFWTTFKWLHVDSALSARDKALVAFGAAAALHCKYCIPFHTAEVAMSGVSDEAIKEASWVANSVAGFGTYLHGSAYDLDQFLAELQAAGEHMMSQAKKG
jgi:AhpD family alkylhydroperoxidase